MDGEDALPEDGLSGDEEHGAVDLASGVPGEAEPDNNGQGNGAGNGDGNGKGTGPGTGNNDGNNGGWTVTLDNDGGNDVAYSVAVDSEGNIIVAGRVSVGGQRVDAWLGKFSSSGTQLWTRTYNAGPGNDYAVAVAVAVDSADDIIIGGRQTGSGQGHDLIARKHTSSGGERWTRTYDGGADDIGYAAAAAPDDSFFVVVGATQTASANDIVIRRHNSP